MSATGREGQWLNSVDNPYTKQYEKLKPNFPKMLYEKQKRIEEIRNKRTSKTQQRKAKIPPFNLHATREFEYTGNSVAPGPGFYIDISDPKYSSVINPKSVYGNTQLNAIKKVANIQNSFGSNLDRFDNPDYKKSVDTPGPGAYTGAQNDSP